MVAIAGHTTHSEYEHIPLKDTVGKTVEAVSSTTVPWGKEPCIVLHFSDGTKHGFVLPTDD